MSEEFKDLAADQESSLDAKIIDLFPPDTEHLDSENATDTECIDMFASIWLHPSTGSDHLAQRINLDTTRNDGDPWHAKLVKIIDTSPFFDHYDELLASDPIFAEMVTFLQKAKYVDQTDEFTQIRKASSILAELYVVAIVKHGDPDHIARVFGKMPHQIP